MTFWIPPPTVAYEPKSKMPFPAPPPIVVEGGESISQELGDRGVRRAVDRTAAHQDDRRPFPEPVERDPGAVCRGDVVHVRASFVDKPLWGQAEGSPRSEVSPDRIPHLPADPGGSDLEYAPCDAA